MNRPLFVYGTLMTQPKRVEVLGRDCTTRPASLAGYALHHGRWPYLIKAGGGTVEGLLLQDLTEADFRVLDDYEDVAQNLYRREEVNVTLEDGSIFSCFIYFANLSSWPDDWK